MKAHPFCLVVCLFVFLGSLRVSVAAPDIVLLRDNFNAATANTTDLNVDIARQTGSLAPITYTLAGGPGHYGHQLQNVNAPDQLLTADFPNSTSSLNRNFNGASSAGGLKISFDLDSVPNVYGAADPGNWGCLNLGMAQADQLVNVNGGVTHFGILFRANGLIQAFDGGAVVTPVEPVYSTRPRGATNHIDIVITDTDGNPFDGVGSTIIEVFANGSGLPVYTFTKSGGGYANNYINVQGSFRAHFDNLTITQLSPDRAPVLVNPSFEVDNFTVFPGYVSGNGPITGWASLGNHGINPAGGSPFADNGAIPDGAKVAFLQGDGAMSQAVQGFSIGRAYRIRYFENSRNCCSGTAPFNQLRVGGVTVAAAHAVPPVGGSNPYREVISDSFTANGTALLVEFIKSNPQGGDTTLLIDNISLVLPDTPPSISIQPADVVAALGETATFSVVVLGSSPLSYQWYFGNDPVPGGTGPVLNVLCDFPDVAGPYKVIASNPFGSITSRVATLTVRLPVPGLFNTGVDANGAALADASVDPHYQLIVNADGPSTDAIVENSQAFPIVAGPWVANTPTSKWIGPRFDTAGAAGVATGGGIYVYRTTFDLSGLDLASIVITGGWAIDNDGVMIRVNGVDTGVVNNNGFASLTSFTLNSGNSMFVNGINTLDFVCRNSDAVAGYTGLRVGNLRGLATLPNTPPSITTQPQSQVGGTGENIVFTVVAAGTSPLAYQWKKDGAPVPGATAPTFTLNNLTHADAGTFTVTITNLYGTITSSNAVLTVRDSVAGLFNTGVDGSGVALADASVDPHYRLIVNPDGASADSIVQDSTVFPIVTGPWVANTAGSKWIGPRFETSAAAGGPDAAGNYTYRLTANLSGFDPSSIEISGLWATDNSGLNIYVNGVASGLSNTTEFAAFTPFRLTNGFLPGLNTIDFQLNNAAVGYTGLRVQGIRGLATLLPPGTAPFIVEQPQNQIVPLGGTATFSVRANGSAPLSYQWFFGPEWDPLESTCRHASLSIL